MKQLTQFRRSRLQNNDRAFFLTDGRIEASLIYQHHVTLSHFAAFELLYTHEGRQLLKTYHDPYISLASQYGFTYLLETPTWRANPDWVFKLGYTFSELAEINHHAVKFLREMICIRQLDNVLLSGCIGPRRAEYNDHDAMSWAEAAFYHMEQVKTLALADVDLISAATMQHSAEAIGIVRAARSLGVPVIVSFVMNKNGTIPSGEHIAKAIAAVDGATDHYAEYFMINCTHPEDINPILESAGKWKQRLRGICATTCLSKPDHFQEWLDVDTASLANSFSITRQQLPNFQLIGGCCNVDQKPLEDVCRRMFAQQMLDLVKRRA